jgi:hypothetical protein
MLVTSASGANGDGYGAILGFSADGSLNDETSNRRNDYSGLDLPRLRGS